MRPRHNLYRQYSQTVWQAVREVVPTVEQTGIDEGYLDLGEIAPDFLAARKLAEAVQAAVRGASALTCSLGVATCKVVAKVASDRRKPGGLTVVRPGRRRRSSRRSTSGCCPASGRARRSACAPPDRDDRRPRRARRRRAPPSAPRQGRGAAPRPRPGDRRARARDAGRADLDLDRGDLRARHRRPRAAARGASADGRPARRAPDEEGPGRPHRDDEGALPGLLDPQPLLHARRRSRRRRRRSARSPARSSTGRSPTGRGRYASSASASRTSRTSGSSRSRSSSQRLGQVGPGLLRRGPRQPRPGDLRPHPRKRLEQRRIEPRSRLRRGDLVHLVDVAVGLRRRPRDPAPARSPRRGRRARARARRSGRPRAAPASAARPSPCTPRPCSSSRPRPRRPRRRRRPPRLRRTAAPQPRRPGAREVDPRRPRRDRRRAGDRAVHIDTEAASGLRRYGVQIGDEPSARTAAAAACLRRRDDREHDVSLRHHLVEPGQELEPGRARKSRRPLAPPGHGRDHPRATAQQRAADGAPHRTGTDDPDRRHAASLRRDVAEDPEMPANRVLVQVEHDDRARGRRARPGRRAARRRSGRGGRIGECAADGELTHLSRKVSVKPAPENPQIR